MLWAFPIKLKPTVVAAGAATVVVVADFMAAVGAFMVEAFAAAVFVAEAFMAGATEAIIVPILITDTMDIRPIIMTIIRDTMVATTGVMVITVTAALVVVVMAVMAAVDIDNPTRSHGNRRTLGGGYP